MNFTRSAIEDVIICEPVVHGDDRGYFSEVYRLDLLNDFLGYSVHFCQDNESMSKKGVLRGLHYQLPPFAQTKLVRVIQGAILDVAVDIRKGSATFGQHVAVELSSSNKRQLLVPRGFAHGFLVLADDTKVAYKVDHYYSANHDRGLLYNDSALQIDWGVASDAVELSEKDKQHPKLAETEDLFDYNQDYYAN